MKNKKETIVTTTVFGLLTIPFSLVFGLTLVQFFVVWAFVTAILLFTSSRTPEFSCTEFMEEAVWP